jgi:hypothetical protein
MATPRDGFPRACSGPLLDPTPRWKNSNKSMYLRDTLAVAAKTSLTELKQIWLMGR